MAKLCSHLYNCMFNGSSTFDSMEFRYFTAVAALQPYVRCFYIFQSGSAIEFGDTVFPSAELEMIFNLGEGIWESFSSQNEFRRNPLIELWGQVTKPMPIKSTGPHTMLGIRFKTPAAAYFLKDDMGVFNNQVADLGDIIGQPVKTLHQQLLETMNPDKQIALVEKFLLERLALNKKKIYRIDKVASIVTSIKTNAAEESVKMIASKHNMTVRNLQKIFYIHTGLSPVSFNKIQRFQQSLKLIAKKNQPLTAIAYNCGYFDQAHFIRDFKSFTGVTPTAYITNKFPVNQSFAW